MRGYQLIIVVCLAYVVSPATSADYALGLVAFDRGDVATAHREFSALAQQGHPAAQYSLAMLYMKSDPPEYARAIPWLEKSARSGLPESQYMLGMLSLYGVGVAKNTTQGMHWLEQASVQGNEDARALLGELKQARVREAERKRRKAEQTRNLHEELDKAKATERALHKRLVESKAREKGLASDREVLEKARASDTRAKETMRLKQTRLEAELEALRVRLAEAERARVEVAAAKPAVVEGDVNRDDAVVEDAPGAAVVTGKVVEVLPDGVVLSDVSRRVEGGSEPFAEGIVVFLNLTSTDGLNEGQEVTYPAEPATPTGTSTKAGPPAVSARSGPSESKRATRQWRGLLTGDRDQSVVSSAEQLPLGIAAEPAYVVLRQLR